MTHPTCTPLTEDEVRYVNRAVEAMRTSHAIELNEMRNRKHRAFSKDEREQIDHEIAYMKKQIEKDDAISEKLYCMYKSDGKYAHDDLLRVPDTYAMLRGNRPDLDK